MTTAKIVLLDQASDDGALCGRPSRVEPASRYVLAVGHGADPDTTASVSINPTDAARLIAALGAWLADLNGGEPDGRVAA
jgi:hypothetical protein